VPESDELAKIADLLNEALARLDDLRHHEVAAHVDMALHTLARVGAKSAPPPHH
jgi:hypothetical protein